MCRSINERFAKKRTLIYFILDLTSIARLMLLLKHSKFAIARVPLGPIRYLSNKTHFFESLTWGIYRYRNYMQLYMKTCYPVNGDARPPLDTAIHATV